MKIPVPKTRSPGALLLITLCFLGSGAVRIFDNGAAIAEEIAKDQKPAMPLAMPAVSADQCPPPLEPESLLNAIREREQQLTIMENRLADREQVLRVSRIRIDEQLVALEEAEKKLAATLALADTAAQQDISRLTSVYESMKPKDAAAIFETMDIDFAAGFLMQMRPDAAAGILANLTSETAYSVSVVMAGRNAGAPTE